MTTLSFPLPNAPTLYAPLPALGEIQRDQAVARIDTPDGGVAYVVTRYADVRTVLVDPRFSRAAAAASGSAAADFGLGALATDSIVGMDPPEHTRLRKLVARAFTARRVEQLRPGTARIVDELIDALLDLPQPADLVEHFSLALPVRVICDMLGVPAGDRDTFHGWSDTLLGGPGADPRVMGAALRAMGEYFAGLIAAKRAKPEDDLMTALIAARDEHDRLTEEELVRLSLGILIGGHETTANQITMILLTLRHFPEQDALLRADPSLIPGAVEELMRFVQLGDGATSLPRVATEDVELSGVTIPKGAVVLPALAVANRDPGVYDEPDGLDVTRKELSHLSFGAGVHHCLGAQLARMELQEALRGLFTRLPGLRVAVPDGELRFKQGMIVRSVEALPVTW
ncbi:cytochrome P450 [Dactylosporangium aurantiacum]|uniref:Cytochrome P450 n=1 Tax=Dactylosporangium aurantiacum TaxID=35754 RepID=A0A9Q9IP60_9ACTN|nr:cytochrome P450 [Dactylosporangium aurantiacum]MDG6108977.1 cytochrome P450 [Dactylosporangium aurantiacum]UWZ56518.1 cytochrome P450 [Dactylosporangium aurantiacum]